MAYRILSLSGGGVRGIFQAAYLHKIGKALSPTRDHFDLVAGTSTGALTALALGLEIDLKMIVDLFDHHGPDIFPRRRIGRVFDQLRWGARYKVQPLREVLTSIFQDRRLGDCTTPVLITATNLDRFGHRVFTTLKLDGEESDDVGLRAVDVALASSAAPTYFASATPRGETRTYVDGGLWANNPALTAVLFARARAHARFEEIRLAIIGNGEVPAGALSVNYDRAWFVKLVSTTFSLMFAAQTTAAEDLSALLMGQANVFKVNPALSSPIGLDDPVMARRVLRPIAESLAEADRSRLVDFLTRPPAVHDLELLELQHIHRYHNVDGDYSAEIIYTVRNASDRPVSELLHDHTSFIGSFAPPPHGPVSIAATLVRSASGRSTVEFEQLSANEVKTRKLDGQERILTRFYWTPKVAPALAPGATLTYAIRVSGQGTEKAVFDAQGSYAGLRTMDPTNRLVFRCEAPPDHRFDKKVTEFFVRSEEGDTVPLSELREAQFDADHRAFTWQISGGAVKTRVNYLVALRFEPVSPPQAIEA